MFALVFSQVLHADEQPETAPREVRHVGKASNDAVQAAKRKQWQNISLALGATTVAVVIILLVAKNQ